MSDALCGPTNPLQQFRKQALTNASFSQDRLAPQRSEQESFRTYHGLNAGVLDAEYDAFLAGGATLSPSLSAHPDFLASSQPNGSSTWSAPNPLDWASEFQNLLAAGGHNDTTSSSWPSAASISLTDPQQQKRWQEPMPEPQRSSSTSANQTILQPHFPSTYYAHTASFSTIVSPGAQYPDSKMPPFLDDLSFEEAFRNVATLLEAEERDGTEEKEEEEAQRQIQSLALGNGTSEAGQLQLRNQMVPLAQLSSPSTARGVFWSANDVAGTGFDVKTPRIGPDAIVDSTEDSSREQADSKHELAVTAGQLLAKVQDNQSQQFRQSQFLRLVRKIRDGDVTVEGSDLVKVG